MTREYMQKDLFGRNVKRTRFCRTKSRISSNSLAHETRQGNQQGATIPRARLTIHGFRATLNGLFFGPAGIVPNIGIAVLHHLVQCGYYFALNDRLALSIARDDGGDRLECFCHVESDVGDVVVCQAQRCAEDVALAKDRRIEGRGDGLETVSGGSSRKWNRLTVIANTVVIR
jgi:hypothetical protein